MDKALDRHARAARAGAEPARPEALADALIAMERDRERERRERQREAFTSHTSERFDLLSAGVELVWSLLKR